MTSDLRSLTVKLDTLHAFVYFAPETGLGFAAAGLEGMGGYFANRAAPMGAVSAPTVIATFHNFSPAAVNGAVPAIWEKVSPEQAIEIRTDAADQALRAMLGDEVDGPNVARLAELLEPVAREGDMVGRPLYAGNAGLDWPEPTHLRLFHAVTLIREYRGDAHMAALTLAGINGCEALARDVASGRSKMPEGLVKATRQWTDEDWDAAMDRIRDAGHLGADNLLNDEGQALREQVEERTDAASLGIWSVLSDAEVAEVQELAGPLMKTVGSKMFNR